MAFYSLEPFGPQAANLNAGIVAAMVRNVNAGKNTKAIRPHEVSQGEFDYDDSVKQSTDDHLTMIKAIAASSGAKVVTREKKKVRAT